MSEAHKLQTLQTLKNRLIKSASNVETESEMIIDALRALDEIEVNKYLINKSGLGNTLSEMRRESCKNHATIKAMITNTLKRWREIALAEQSGSSSNVAGEGTATAAASSSSVPTTAPAAKASSAFPTARAAVPQATGDPAILSENHTRKMAISSDRRTIVQVISKIFQKFMEDTAVPDRIALGIEEELNKVHHHDKAKTQYTSKAKTLSFNISKNEVSFN